MLWLLPNLLWHVTSPHQGGILFFNRGHKKVKGQSAVLYTMIDPALCRHFSCPNINLSSRPIHDFSKNLLWFFQKNNKLEKIAHLILKKLFLKIPYVITVQFFKTLHHWWHQFFVYIFCIIFFFLKIILQTHRALKVCSFLPWTHHCDF